jgi:hypothetical protein
MTGSDNPSTADLKPSETAVYQVLSANSIRELEKQVNTVLKAGLRPYGYPFQFKDSICQAVIKV